MSTANKDGIKDDKLTNLLKKNNEMHTMKQDWTFYYLIPAKYNADKNVDWKNYLNVLYDFNTFEVFWSIIASIEPARKLQKGCRYYIFKKDQNHNRIEPLWEDEHNKDGKEISIEYKNDTKRRGDNQELARVQKSCEEKWIHLCTSVFCNNPEYFKNIDKINGIEFNIRAQTIKVGIWTEKVTEEEFQQLKSDLHKIMVFDGKDPNSYAIESNITLERITK